MLVLKILGIVYLLSGLVYAIYVYSIGSGEKWYKFPIDVLGGPIMVVYLIIISIRNKKLPIDWS